MLLIADVAALTLAFAVTEVLFAGRNGMIDEVGAELEIVVFLAMLPAWVVAAKIYGLYDRDEERADHSTVDEFVSVFHLVTVGVWLFFAFSWASGLENPDQAKLAAFWALSIGLVTGGRSAARAGARRRPEYKQNVLIIGAGEVGQLVGRKLIQHAEYGANLVGFVDPEPRELRAELRHLPVTRSFSDLSAVIDRLAVDRVVVAFSRDSHEEVLSAIRGLRGMDVKIDIVPRLFQALGTAVHVHAVEGLPLVGVTPARLSRSSLLLKRTVDLVGASVVLVLTTPLFVFIAWRIKRDSAGPVFFRQTRLGVGMREFRLMKFRTMRHGADEAPHRQYIERIADSRAEPEQNNLYKLDRRDEVTSVGTWLRKTSLDELPQLINVLRGEMSLVGPRPCIPYEIDHFAPHHFERFLVPAGITGLWQVAARAHSTFGEALDLDVAYARSWSLGLDLQLLFKTPRVLLRTGETA